MRVVREVGEDPRGSRRVPRRPAGGRGLLDRAPESPRVSAGSGAGPQEGAGARWVAGRARGWARGGGAGRGWTRGGGAGPRSRPRVGGAGPRVARVAREEEEVAGGAREEEEEEEEEERRERRRRWTPTRGGRTTQGSQTLTLGERL